MVKIAISGRMEKLLAGVITVEDLDDMELARGQCRDTAGGFTGRPPRIIPREMHQEMLRRLFERSDELLQGALLITVRMFLEVVSDPNQTAADRMKAGVFIFENVRGKAPQTVRLEASDPVVQLFTKIFSDPGALEPFMDGEYEEAEVVAESAASGLTPFG